MNATRAPSSLADAGAGYIGRIPVRNLWLLMLYASDLFRTESNVRRVRVEEQPDEIPDLVAEILAHAVESRLHRNLSQSYIEREAVLGRVRGRIDLLSTERHLLLERGRVACRFSELTPDTIRNRYVRAALVRIARDVTNGQLASRCRKLALMLERLGVSPQVPTRAQIASDRIGRNDAADRTMVAAARLAFDLSLPTEDVGSIAVTDPAREKRWVYRLFERGVAGLFRAGLPPEWRVQTGKRLDWPIDAASEGLPGVLPIMEADIVLENAAADRRVVIDTKFNSILTQSRFGRDVLKSGYLYQLYAYLRTQASGDDRLAVTADGMLLHPAIGCDFDEQMEVQGHTIRVASIDLTCAAIDIREEVLGLITEPKANPSNAAGPDSIAH